MSFWFFKSAEEKQRIARARDAFIDLQHHLATPQEVMVRAKSFPSQPSLAALSPRERRRLGAQTLRKYGDAVLADDHLTVPAENAFAALADSLGLKDVLNTEFRDLMLRILIAKANDGRLQTMSSPKLVASASETVHFEWPATLLKLVEKREFRGHSSGVSFKIAKGVRYHVGAFRGHSVVIGTELKTADTGTLSITSKRTMFLGSQKTLEFPYTKLAHIEVFNDGVRINVTNRQTASMFRVENGHVIAALMNAAYQHTV